MSELILLPELHQLIIGVIGDEVVDADLVVGCLLRHRVARKTLQACSLVCKAWYASALRYTYHTARLPMVGGSDKTLKRNAELFRLLEANPSIRQCIRRVQISLEFRAPPEDVEKVCSAISTVEELYLVLCTFPPELPRPLLVALHPILSSRYLRGLYIETTYLPIQLLADAPNIRTLTLSTARGINVVHGQDGAWGVSTLEKLVTKQSTWDLFDQIQSFGARNVNIDAFFDRLKYLDVDVYQGYSGFNNSWPVLWSRWRCLETIVLRWSFSGASVSIHFLMRTLIQVDSIVYR